MACNVDRIRMDMVSSHNALLTNAAKKRPAAETRAMDIVSAAGRNAD
jgi:hypothetical protein